MSEYESMGYDSLCEKIQELVEEIGVLRQDVNTDDAWGRITQDLESTFIKLEESGILLAESGNAVGF
ncbi:MAG: hypothetical protein LKE51_03410 [Selenomonas sp.]|nr:hypothetical protein [Selenomonas sp.]